MSDPLIPGGYILLSRKIIEDQIWSKPPLYLKVWIYLLACAQHSDYKGLKRGQMFTTIPDIIDACKWKVGARTERPTKDQIFQIIEWLRKPDEHPNGEVMNTPTIATTKATQGMVISVEKYCFYQDPKNYESNDEHTIEHDAKATRRQRQPDNINKNVKNEKNVKNDRNKYSPEFESFWSVYPKRIEKAGAFKAWNAQINDKVPAETLIQAATNYAKHCLIEKTIDRYIKHPKTFLGPSKPYEDFIQDIPKSTPTHPNGLSKAKNEILEKYRKAGLK